MPEVGHAYVSTKKKERKINVGFGLYKQSRKCLSLNMKSEEGEVKR